MPELPEVEIVRRGLAPVLCGAHLTRVTTRRPDLRFPFPPDFVQTLTGARVVALDRRGKYLLARLDRDRTLLMHLGMTGRFEIGAVADPASADRHAHVAIETDGGYRVTFHDPRRFGFMELIAGDDDGRVAGLGPEPLGEDFDGASLADAFAGRRQPIKASLLDQRVVAGLGNIYVSEALHAAALSPLRPAGAISISRLTRLAAAVRSVLEAAIAKGGSTLRDFAAADGSLGYFQHSFAVYDRAGEPCSRAGCRGKVRRIVQAGRATFYCPACQR
jgi:formamidopyrimidine-DNA glycosylase